MADLDKDATRNQTLPLMILIDAGNVIQRGLERRLSHLNLSLPQQRILTAVYFAKESLTPTTLAALLLQEPHSVSGMLNRLDERGLITRTHDRQDRRVVWVGLTPVGREAVERAISVVVSLAHELAPVLGGRRSNNAVDVLGRARDVGIRMADVPEAVREEALRRVWGHPS